MLQIKALDIFKVKTYSLYTLILCSLSGVIYNSWPFGYLLDKSTARFGLASDLEKTGHPYYWLFIAGDVISSLLAIMAAYVIYLDRPNYLKKYFNAIWVGLIIFGFFTIVASYLPTECQITPVIHCQLIANKGLGVDALASTIAAVGLFVSLLAIVLLSKQYRMPNYIKFTTQLVYIAWILCGISFIFLSINNVNTHQIQQILISLSGLSLGLIGLNTYAMLQNNDMKKLNQTKPSI